MKYTLFAGDAYYPLGGLEDFKGEFNSLEAMTEAAKGFEWWHGVDENRGLYNWSWDVPKGYHVVSAWKPSSS